MSTEKQLYGYRLRKALLMAAIVMAFIVSAWSTLGIDLHSLREDKILVWSEDRTLAANYDLCKDVLEGPAESLSYRKKLEFFETAVDIESNYLCIPYRITVKTGSLSDGTSGNFSAGEQTITIDKEYLTNCEDPWELVELAAHEVFHAWEYEACRLDEVVSDRRARAFLYDELSNVEDYRKELRHYEDEGLEYYYQTVEADARRYASNSIEMWKDRLAELAE